MVQTPPAEAPVAAELRAPAQRDWPPGELRAGRAVEAELGPEHTHTYRLPLETGQFLRLQVEQHGVDVELSLRGPGGQLLLTADRLIFDRGPELVMVVAEASGAHSLDLAALPGSGPGRYEARIEALRPASDRDRLAAITYRRFRQAESLSREKKLAAWHEALDVWRRLGEPMLEGEVHFVLARDRHFHREYEQAAASHREAAAAFARGGDHRWRALAESGLGATLLTAGRIEESLEVYRDALPTSREVNDVRTEGAILNGLGHAYHQQGEIQAALSHYEAALGVLAENDRATRPYTLHNLGVLRSVYFHDLERGRELLTAAQDLWREDWYRARTLSQLARAALEDGALDEARVHIEAALALPQGFDRCGRATHLSRLALIEERQGSPGASDARLGEAMETLEATACPRARVTIHLLAGLLAEGRGEDELALARYEEGRRLASEQGDRTRLADSLAGIARAERALGRPQAALAASREALSILEEVRPTVLREDLRAAYFATAQDQFDFHIDLLTETGSWEEAWIVAERARAQALRDLVLEGGVELRQSADPALVSKERSLRRRLNVLAKGLLDSVREPSAERLEARQRQIDALVEEVETVRGEIRRRSPAYAALTSSEAPSLRAVQRDLLDPETLLLEYRLGEGSSWLWAITRDSFRGYVLPPRAEIEVVAQEAAHWTQSLRWPDRNPAPLCELSSTLLGPVADLLEGRRLVVVPDGALEELSFAALPVPGESTSCAETEQLVAAHEITYLPSVGALAAQRRLLADRRPASGLLAMLADPVYGPDDDRLVRRTEPRPASLARSTADRFERLLHSAEEAEAVLSSLPRNRTFAVTGLGASKETVITGSLARHRIVHFATHGVLDPEQPLLSFLALSQVSADGRPVEGNLYAHEIYDLDLPAELVVLSACDTARGRQIRGEGLVSGLPRAFLYAGAARVVVSLWPVPDRSTRDLMDLFYRGLVEESLPPGRALQQAQRALWQDGRPPYQWAGFVLQGDWRPLPPF